MQNLFFRAICQAGIFMICAQAIVHFRPKEAYEKYLKLLVSLMVLIQLFLPVGSFLLGGGGQETEALLKEFRRELEQGIKDVEESAAEADEILGQMTLEEIRRQMEENAEREDGGSVNGGSTDREDVDGADTDREGTNGGSTDREDVESGDTDREDKEGVNSGSTDREGKESLNGGSTDREDMNGGGAEQKNGSDEDLIQVKPVDPVSILN